MSMINEFERLLGDNITVGNAVIVFIPNKDVFTLDIHGCGPAVCTLFDLGHCVLLRCNLEIDEYVFQQNEEDALFYCNIINRDIKWIKSILNEGYKLELKGEALTGKDVWYNDILKLLEEYVACATFLYGDCCTKYGEF